jgi:hypothetical protein
LTAIAKRLAKRLLNENARGRSWRKIAREDYGDKVNFATLNRIAKSGGEWIPKNKEILVALGLSKPRSKFPRPAWLLKWYRLPKDERWKVIENYLKGKTL